MPAQFSPQLYPQFSHRPPDCSSAQAQFALPKFAQPKFARPNRSSERSGQRPRRTGGLRRQANLILPLLAILVSLLTSSLGGRASAQSASPQPAVDPKPNPADLPTTRPTTRPTANFVPQATLDAAQRLATQSTPTLPGLGQPDKFLPDLDPLAQVHLVLKLSERRVYVYSRDQLKTSFPVAIGRAGWETPVGNYQVIQMQHDPTWEHPFTGELVPPGRDNPLGVRWIGFWTDGTNYIGFHGTPNEESVGRPASHGCVRMYNRDVVKLFEMVRLGTPVEVVP